MLDALCDSSVDIDAGVNDNPHVVSETNQSLATEENCDRLRFSDLCQTLDEVESIKGPEKKFLKIFNRKLLSLLNGQSVYPLMRLVVPLVDTERGKYGIKQSAVAKTYVDALHLEKKTSQDAQRLIHWKDPSKISSGSDTKIIGDFSTILEDVLQSRVMSESWSYHTIGDVNALLDDIAHAPTREEKSHIILHRVINQYSAREQKWLVRIIFQDMKIGLQYEQILKRFYPGALQRFNECTNLRTVCEEQCLGIYNNNTTTNGGSGGSGGNDKMMIFNGGLQLFKPFKPMLAKGFSTSHGSNQVLAVEKAMSNYPFVMDVKLDGERMMIHIWDNDVKIFSRESTDYTTMYNSLAEDVRNHVKFPQCILDGEVCAWDNENECLLKFGGNKSAAREELEDEGLMMYNTTTTTNYNIEQVDIDVSFPSFSNPSTNDMSSNSNNNNNNSNNNSNGNKKIFERKYLHLSKWLVFIAFDIVYLNGPGTHALVTTACDKFDCAIDDEEATITGVSTTTATVTATSTATANKSSGSDSSWRKTSELIQYPLAVRREILEKVFYCTELHRVEIVQHQQVINTTNIQKRHEAIEEYFNQVTIAGEEGLVIKNLSSMYEIGGNATKRLEHWVKVKPEYGGQVHDLDVVILGGYYGEGVGYRGQGISKFLVGVRDDKAPGGYVTLGKVGTGYSHEDLKKIRSLWKDPSVAKIWNNDNNTNGTKTSSSSSLPLHLLPSSWKINKADDRPNIWIVPEKSIVLELKCAELIDSTAFSAGVTCRFPRVNRVRYDKPVSEIMTLNDVLDIKKAPRMTILEADNHKKRRLMDENEGGERGGGEEGEREYDDENQQQTSSSSSSSSSSYYSKFKPFSHSSSSSSGSRHKHDSNRMAEPSTYTIKSTISSGRSNRGTGTGNTSKKGNSKSSLTLIDDKFRVRPSVRGSERQGDLFQGCVFWLVDDQFSADIEIPHNNSHNNDNGMNITDRRQKTPHYYFKKYTRQELIDAISSQGGKVVASGVPNCNCIAVAGSKRTFQVSNLIERGVYDVISCSYIIECLEFNTLVPLTSLYYFGYSPETRTRLRGVIDPLGDSYTIEISYRELYHLLYDDTMNHHHHHHQNNDLTMIQRLQKNCKHLERSINDWEKNNQKMKRVKYRTRVKKMQMEKKKLKMKRLLGKQEKTKSMVLVSKILNKNGVNDAINDGNNKDNNESNNNDDSNNDNNDNNDSVNQIYNKHYHDADPNNIRNNNNDDDDDEEMPSGSSISTPMIRQAHEQQGEGPVVAVVHDDDDDDDDSREGTRHNHDIMMTEEHDNHKETAVNDNDDDDDDDDDGDKNKDNDSDSENDDDDDDDDEEEESYRKHMAEVRELFETRLLLLDYYKYTGVTNTTTTAAGTGATAAAGATGGHSSTGLQWREIAAEMNDEERAVLDVGRVNCLYSPDIIFYVDTGQDFGDLQPTRNPLLTTHPPSSSSSSSSSSSVPITILALKSRLKLYGAQVSECLHMGVTHVVVMQSSWREGEDRLNNIKIRLRLLRLQEGHVYEKLLVTPVWIEACIEAEKFIEPVAADDHLVVK